MGTSKGVLLSGIAVIIGLYTIGIRRADSVYASSSSARVNMMQARYLAQSGIQFGLRRLEQGYTSTPDIIVLSDPTGSNPTITGEATSLTTTVSSWPGGTWSSWWTTGSATLTAVGQYNNVRVTITAVATGQYLSYNDWYYSNPAYWSISKTKYYTSPTVQFYNSSTGTWVNQQQDY